MAKTNPSYYAILTSDVRYDNMLTDSEKLLFAEITALTNSTGECWATNSYFADLYGVSTRSIIRRIQALLERKYITSQMIYKKDSKEVEKRVLRLVRPIDKPVTTPTDKIVTTPPDKSVTDNTTSINTTSNNISKEIDSKINDLYNLYPSECVVRGKVSLGKTTKNKNKIRFMITKSGNLNKEKAIWLEAVIKRYVQDCISNKTWMKNFSTFLNNIPDYENLQVEEQSTDQECNSFGTPIPMSLPKVKNKGQLDREFRGLIDVMGEKWYYDMELNEWITVEQSKIKNK